MCIRDSCCQLARGLLGGVVLSLFTAALSRAFAWLAEIRVVFRLARRAPALADRPLQALSLIHI
eukprot:5366987-Alexandrium_andersonii.AAC.1